MSGVRLGLAALAAVGLAGCSMFGGGGGGGSTYHAAAAPPAPAPMQRTAPVAPVTIRDVQSALQHDGYYKNNSVDGVWGPRTERAVKRFQHDHNLTSNGQLDVPTLQALNLTGAPPSTGQVNNEPSSNPAADNTPDDNAAANQPADNTPADNAASNNPPQPPPNSQPYNGQPTH
jgi:peptidoglycan hydrolase-like protein with peptidoglycan-binding domain